MTDPFSDVLEANQSFPARFAGRDVPGRAARGLVVLTCMDSRIDPLRMLGLQVGDAKVLRNAGARVTDEVLDTLIVARYLLDVRRVMVIAHTKCRMASGTEAELHDAIRAAGGPDTSGITFGATVDQLGALRADVAQVTSSPFLTGVDVGGFLYDVDTGLVSRVL